MFVPDWNQIQEDVTFHHLLNELFLAELSFTNCQPGAPSGGRDRGFDILYRGAMPTIFPDLNAGLWMIQAKYTKKNFAEAREHLERELTGRQGASPRKGEIEKAIDAGADYLLVVTQAELQPDQADQLERLAPQGKLRSVRVLHRQKLTPLIMPKAWLLRHYFAAATHPGLLPVTRYRDGSEALPLADLSFTGRDSDLQALKEIVVRGERSVVVVHGQGGVGKSRFLKEAAIQAHALFPERQVYFFSRAREAQATANDELPPRAKYLVVIDDAEKDYEHGARAFMRLACSGGLDAVFLLSCRDGAVESLRGALAEDGIFRPECIQLPPLDRDVCLDLVGKETGLDDRQQRRLYRATSGNLFLLSAAIAAIRQGSQPFSFVTERQVRDEIVRRVEHQARHALEAARQPLQHDLLGALAVLVPFADGDSEQTDLLSSFAGEQDKQVLMEQLEALVRAGVLRRVGRYLRFGADMLGDFVLSHRLGEADRAAFLRAVVEKAIRVRPDAVITNLVHVGGLGNENATRTLTSILHEWTREEGREPTSDRTRRLEVAQPMAYLVPEAVLDFVEAVLDAPDPPPEKQRPADRKEAFRRAVNGERFVDRLSTDHVCPALSVAGTSAQYVGRALDLLRLVRSRATDGVFDNHKPVSIVQSWLSPVEVGPDTIRCALTRLGQWMDQPTPDATAIELAFAGVRNILKSCWHHEEHEPGLLTFGPRALDDSPPLRSVRQQAMAILKSAFVHPSPSVRRAAVEAAGKIGESHPILREAGPLESVAAEERREGLEVIAAQMDKEQDLAVLYAMEDVLLQTWLMQKPGVDVAEEALTQAPRPIELKLLRWTLQPRAGFDSFAELKHEAPVNGRWSWWVHRDTRLDPTSDQLVEAFRPVTDEIMRYFPGPEGFLALLHRLADAGCCGSGLVPVWLWSVASQCPEVIEACLGDPGITPSVPPPFLSSLKAVWTATDQHAYGKSRAQLPPRLVEAEPEDVLWLLRTLQVAADRPGQEEAIAILEKAAGHLDRRVRLSVVDWHVNALKVPADRRLLIHTTALRAGYDRGIAEQVLEDIEYHIVPAGIEVDRSPLREVVTEAFINVRDHDDMVLPNLLLWCLEGNVEAWLHVLERHLQAGGDLWGLRLASHHVSRLVQDPVHSVSDLTLALVRAAGWHEAGLIDEMQLSEFQRWLGTLDYRATNEYVAGVARERREADYVVCARLLRDRGFSEPDQILWRDLLRAARGSCVWPTVASKFVGTASFIRAYTGGKDGEPPPALTARLAELARLRDQAQPDEPHLARLVKDAMAIVSDHIQLHRLEHEEHIDPR